MSNIQEILTELGYSPSVERDGWRMAALYRSGDNSTALKVYSDGWCNDYVTGERFNLETLIKRTLNIDDTKAKDWLKGKIDIEGLEKKEYKEKLKVPEIFDKEILRELIPDYSYFERRGISKQTCETFKGGLCLEGSTLIAKLKNRQVLNIYDSKNNLVAFTGRSIDDRKPKWKHLGSVTNTIFPGYLNNKIIKESQEVILVESPLCTMKLWDCGIKNSLALFGIECSFPVVNYLLKINPKKIFISLNNEIDFNGGVGNQGAEKVYARLKRYFSHNQIKIHLPPCKDFADKQCTEEMIKDWYNKR